MPAQNRSKLRSNERAASSTASITPLSTSGVVGVLNTRVSPTSVATQRSVKVPPTSLPTKKRTGSAVCRRSGAAADEHGGGAVHQHFALGVEEFEQEIDPTAVGSRARRCGVAHGEPEAHALVGPQRFEEADLFDAGRAEIGGIEQHGVDGEPHGDAAGVPAAGDDPAETGRGRVRVVEMEGLRIEIAREGDDLGLRYRPAAAVEDLTRPVILPVAQASTRRRCASAP